MPLLGDVASWCSPSTSWSSFARRTKRSPAAAEHRRGELGRVARPLGADARRVQLVVGRRVAEARDGAAQPLPLAAPERRRADGRRPATRGTRRRLLEPVEDGEVAVALERLEQRGARGEPAAASIRSNSACECVALALVERGRLRVQVLEQDVVVAHRPERGAEPAQLRLQPLLPLAVEQRPRGAQERARAARGDAQLVDVLGVVADADAGVVPRAAARSCAREQRAQRADGGRRVAGRRPASSSSPSAWTSFGRGLGSPAPARRSCLPMPAQEPGVALDELGLDLLPGARDALARRAPRPSRARPRRRAPSSATRTPARRVRSRATGTSSPPRVSAGRSAKLLAGHRRPARPRSRARAARRRAAASAARGRARSRRGGGASPRRARAGGRRCRGRSRRRRAARAARRRGPAGRSRPARAASAPARASPASRGR